MRQKVVTQPSEALGNNIPRMQPCAQLAVERIGWISTANHRGFRSLVDRGEAAIFTTREEAQSVIEKLRSAPVSAFQSN